MIGGTNMRTKSKKLPEQPPANLEEVKRRFIRQNRELAKANSTQSLRIRSLENENSRLLDEILRLRERNLWLERDRQNAQVCASSEAIRKIKDELQAKFAELSGFVENLSELKDHANDEDYLLPKERLLSPSQRQYRERQPLAELMQECVMPTITEDKAYSQESMDVEGSRSFRLSDHDSNASPDIGPPPVARLDCDNDETPDAVVTTEQKSSSTIPPEMVRDDDMLTANMSVNLETRRRKKESQSGIEIRRRSTLAQSLTTPEDENSTTILRTGAKRKLADRDSEKPIKPPSKDDFTFSRKPTITTRPIVEIEQPTEDTTPSEEVVQDPSSPAKPPRKILGSKSTNISPRKPLHKVAKPEKDGLDKGAPPRLSISRQRVQSRSRRVSTAVIPPPEEVSPATAGVIPSELAVTEDLVELAPETPAAADLFSPSTSEPSAKQPVERGDTPPPSDLSSISNTTEGGQRPSRRVRSAVNYAEPSLVAKMRRPGKEMVDAITGIQDPRRATNEPGSRKSHGVTPSSQSTSVKKEAGSVDELPRWQSLPLAAQSADNSLDPGSPLHSRAAAVAAPAVTLEPSEIPLPSERSGSSTAISTLLAASRKRRESATGAVVTFDLTPEQAPERDTDEATKRIEEMNLYEFKESSSPASEKIDGEGSNRQAATTTVRSGKAATQRRHSSIVKEKTDKAVVSSLTSARERAASRRRSTLL